MNSLFADIKNFALDTIFPITCLSCDTPGKLVCKQCLQSFTRLEHQRCIVCQKPSLHGITHSGCYTPHLPDGSLSVFDYHDIRLANTIVQAKYKFLPDAYIPLGSAIKDFILNEGLKNYFAGYVLCPVPLHKNRQRWRGFNQAEILAQQAARELWLTCDPVLSRSKSTKTQKDLSKIERNKNVAGVFSLNYKADSYQGKVLDWLFHYEKPVSMRPSVLGKGVLLIDDVVTTGSTLIEATKVLKRNGAKSVWCVTVARD